MADADGVDPELDARLDEAIAPMGDEPKVEVSDELMGEGNTDVRKAPQRPPSRPLNSVRGAPSTRREDDGVPASDKTDIKEVPPRFRK